jgi:hypothetical protein
VEYLFLWILFGIASAYVAGGKGRNWVGWFILGVLLGPFGLILAHVVSSKTPKSVDEKPVNPKGP